MNEPILIELDGRNYVRWNAGVYTCDGSTHPHGLRQRVTDAATINKLNARYGDMQRQTSSGPRPPFGIVPGVRQPAGKRPAFKTPRESKGRVE
jgi:hypothetical protein